MRDQWYGGDLDVLKWGALIHIARRDDLSAILHVAMFRPDEGDDRATLISSSSSPSSRSVPIPGEVTRHFRNLDNLHRLSKPSGIRLEVFKAPFRHRSVYFEKVHRRIAAFSAQSLAVFLDPDVGLASEMAGPEHVSTDEVGQVFAALKPGDVLACYQQARRQKDWRGDRRRAFTRAIDVTAREVEVFESPLAKGLLFSAMKT